MTANTEPFLGKLYNIAQGIAHRGLVPRGGGVDGEDGGREGPYRSGALSLFAVNGS